MDTPDLETGLSPCIRARGPQLEQLLNWNVNYQVERFLAGFGANFTFVYDMLNGVEFSHGLVKTLFKRGGKLIFGKLIQDTLSYNYAEFSATYY